MARNLKDVINSFKCDSQEPVASATIANFPRKVTKAASQKRKHPSKSGVQASVTGRIPILKDLPPSLAPDLSLVFIGFNPGVESSKTQHHYAHPTNLFWKLFNASDLLSAVLDMRDTDTRSCSGLLEDIYKDGQCQARPEHDYRLIDLGVGFTDLVLRCTKQASELSSDEKKQNVPRLLEEFNQTSAPFIVFIGKGIWEVVCKYLIPKHKLTSGNFSWGHQTDPLIIRRFHSFCPYLPQVYVFPNTSGLVASMKYPEKLALWENLVCVVRSSLDKSCEASINPSRS